MSKKFNEPLSAQTVESVPAESGLDEDTLSRALDVSHLDKVRLLMLTSWWLNLSASEDGN